MVRVPPPGMASAALRMRLRKACSSWGASPRHGRQAGMKFARQFDVLVLEFVPDQQAQFVDQLVEVHRRELRFGGAGEIEDLLDDLVQVLDLLVNDARVLGARVARRGISGPASDKASSSP